MLNAEQSRAALHKDGPLLLLAGAGTGKTRTLTFRISNLIQKYNTPSYQILAVTFTNKAAHEMKERLAQLLKGETNEVMVGTFHSVCLRILRRYIDRLGFDQDFSIYGPDEQVKVIKSILKAMGKDPKKFPPKIILNKISHAKNELISPEKFGGKELSFIDEIAGDVYTRYQAKLQQLNAVDFDDLIGLVVRLFQEHPDVLSYYQKRWKYLHIDEYQDTNHAQYTWSQLLAKEHHNICVVGDDWQSIYSWRGADMRNILNFETDYPEVTTIKLEQNYRSCQNILDAADNIIKQNTERTIKKLWTERTDNQPIGIIECLDERHEAEKLISTIQKHLSRNEVETISECVILYRTNSQSRILEEACMRHQIPYTIVGGVRFYERKEVKDILAYLTLIMNSNDLIAFGRIVNVPTRGIGKTTIDKVVGLISSGSNGLSLFESSNLSQVLMNPEQMHGVRASTQSALQNLGELLIKWKKAAQEIHARHLIEMILEDTGYLDHLKDKTEGAEQRIENIQELANVASKYDNTPAPESLKTFLYEVSLVSSYDTNTENGSLTLMTMHASKGLEFDLVCIGGLEEGLFPHSRTLNDASEMEEERRLAYVGITRARKYCYLSYAKSRMVFGQKQYNKRSQFIDIIPTELTDQPKSSYESGTGGKAYNYFSNEPRYTPEEEVVYQSFEKGQMVTHPSFGKGIVKSVTGDILTIKFSAGEKKIAANIANLR